MLTINLVFILRKVLTIVLISFLIKTWSQPLCSFKMILLTFVQVAILSYSDGLAFFSAQFEHCCVALGRGVLFSGECQCQCQCLCQVCNSLNHLEGHSRSLKYCCLIYHIFRMSWELIWPWMTLKQSLISNTALEVEGEMLSNLWWWYFGLLCIVLYLLCSFEVILLTFMQVIILSYSDGLAFFSVNSLNTIVLHLAEDYSS